MDPLYLCANVTLVSFNPTDLLALLKRVPSNNDKENASQTSLRSIAFPEYFSSKNDRTTIIRVSGNNDELAAIRRVFQDGNEIGHYHQSDDPKREVMVSLVEPKAPTYDAFGRRVTSTFVIVLTTRL